MAYYFICHFGKTMSRIKIANTEATILKIINDRCSIGRFGDGEFYIIENRPNASGFQNNDTTLSHRLKEVLTKTENNFLIGVPISLKNTTGQKMYAKLFWKSFVTKNRRLLSNLMGTDTQYYNAQITRFYIDYRYSSESKKTAALLRSIWAEQDVLIIEGEYSKLGIGNDLFDNCKSIERIICPAKNAFAAYDRILSAAKKHSKDKLVLIALGMTATVLAYDLCAYGFWALDVGHVDIEYMWMKMGATSKCPIPGKYVNEVSCNKSPLNYDDGTNHLYESQIICRIL